MDEGLALDKIGEALLHEEEEIYRRQLYAESDCSVVNEAKLRGFRKGFRQDFRRLFEVSLRRWSNMTEEKKSDYTTPLYDALPIPVQLFVDEVVEMKVELDLGRYYEMAAKEGLKDFAMLMRGMYVEYDTAVCRERYAERLDKLCNQKEPTRGILHENQ